jgi:hypothetical protein
MSSASEYTITSSSSSSSTSTVFSPFSASNNFLILVEKFISFLHAVKTLCADVNAKSRDYIIVPA